MCRMMATVGTAPGWDVFQQFRDLAADGAVMPGDSPGHGDGWGLAGLAHGSLVFLEKSGKSAVEDAQGYNTAVRGLIERSLTATLAHLRKASVGTVTRENAHPFANGNIAFCHNGGVRQSQELEIFGLEPTGQTDSERFFLNILGRVKSGEAPTIKDAIIRSVSWIHENLNYTCLNFFLTDGKRLYAYRDYRAVLRPGEESEPKNFKIYPTYYTLYHSASAGAFSSEPLPRLARDWRLMANGELVEAQPDGHTTITYLKGHPAA